MRQTAALVDFYRRGAAVAPPVREYDRSRAHDRAAVAVHVVISVWVVAIVLSSVSSLEQALTAAVFVYLGHSAVDPVNGLVHFVVDNYFSRTTPILGEVVDGFLNHHERPAMITRIQFARNVAPVMALSLPGLAMLIVLRPVGTAAGLAASSFVGAFLAETGFSMEAHKYAHMNPRQLPPAIRWLQRRGWLVSREKHARHHARRPGFDADFASVTGKSNRYLTASFFRRVELTIYRITKRFTGAGVEPRSWRDPAIRSEVAHAVSS